MNEEIAWWNAHFGEPEVQRASATIRSNYLNEGALTRELEAKFATFLSAGHVDATPNGTVALALCLWALGIQPGEEVIVPDLTFIATANAVHMVGGRPVPVDVRSDDFTLSPEQTEAAITRKTKAIIVVHVNGRAVDLAAFQALRDKTGLPIIEDTAQGLGSKSGERYLGTIFDMAAISLAPSKIISTGQGGLVITNDRTLHDNVVRLKDHGRLARSDSFHPVPGHNYKFTDLQAAVGLAQFDKLPQRLEKAKRDHRFYREALADVEGIRLVPVDGPSGAVPLWVDALSDRRATLMAAMRERHIELRPFWDCLHRQWLGGDPAAYPVSREAERTGFWLPSGPALDTGKMEIVCHEIKKFFAS